MNQVTTEDFTFTNVEQIMKKYPDKIPVICKQYGSTSHYKFMIPTFFTVGQLLMVVRRRSKITPDKALFLFVGQQRIIPSATAYVHDLYLHHSQNRILYVCYSYENTFGADG